MKKVLSPRAQDSYLELMKCLSWSEFSWVGMSEGTSSYIVSRLSILFLVEKNDAVKTVASQDALKEFRRWKIQLYIGAKANFWPCRKGSWQRIQILYRWLHMGWRQSYVGWRNFVWYVAQMIQFIRAIIGWLIWSLMAQTTLLTLVLLNKLRCHALFKFSANQITWCRLLL